MKVEQFDAVILKDGRRADIVEKWTDTLFEGEIYVDGSYKLIGVRINDIDHVLPPHSREGISKEEIDMLNR